MIRARHPSDKWYKTASWERLRQHVLHRNPICLICKRAPATCVDHIINHDGNWESFRDVNNLQALCRPCHSIKTVKENCGFGHAPTPGPILSPTGTKKGNEWIASSVSQEALDKALQMPVDFLKGIPE